MQTHRKCAAALSSQLARLSPGAKRIPTHPEYTAELTDNLVPGIESRWFESEYGHGAGQELRWTVNGKGLQVPPKMHATYSSSALVVNTFGRWRQDPSTLCVHEYAGFESIAFEAQCPTGLKGIPPHLDVLCRAENRPVVGIESKCLEFLHPHELHFAASYDSLGSIRQTRPYFDLIASLRKDPAEYVYLNVAQLIKHAFGLATCFPQQPVVLLYLFWEPTDWRLYAEFAQHRHELSVFQERVRGAAVPFVWMTYPDLWDSWATHSSPWVRQHVESLNARYRIRIHEPRP